MQKSIFIIPALFLLLACAACGEDAAKKRDTGKADTPATSTAKSPTEEANKPAVKRKSAAVQTAASDTKPGKNKPGNDISDETVTGGSRQKLLKLVNNVRAKGCRCGGKYYKPVPPVKWNTQLEKAAKKHSRYMQQRNILSHTGRGGSDAGRRISKERYNWISYGENVASGYPNEEAVIKGWLKSNGHCKNIMSPKFTEMGVARSGAFWTQVFATRQ